MQTLLRRPILRGLWMPLALLAGGLLAPTVHAQTSAPRAGTSIGNKASATYTDNSNVWRSTQSNTVSTLVQQVPAVDLTDPRNVRAYPSAPVNFAHTVSNTGNGPDSFNLSAVFGSGTNVTPLFIYADANGDGIADSNTVITTTPTLQPGESFGFVVTGQVPPGAVQNDTGTINVTASSVANSGASDTNLDTITVSTNANIVLRKSVSKDSGAPDGTTQYTYTLSYVNNSQFSAGKTTITDTIPAALAEVLNSGVWQGNTLTDATGNVDATITNSDGTTSSMDYSVTGGALTANISRVPPGQGTISFKFTVPANTPPQVTRNTAVISYDDNNDGDITTSTPTPRITDNSNTVPFTITPITSFTFIGPPTVPSVPQGGTVSFNNTLTNNGTGTDTFDIRLVPPATGAFPAGTTFQLFKSDGVTPLLDTNGNSVPDTGPVAGKVGGVGTPYVVVLKAILPSGAVGGPFEMDKVATSGNDGTTQTAIDKVTSVTATTMDLANRKPSDNSILGAGAFVASTTPTLDLPGTAGAATRFPLRVSNGGPSGSTDSFVLSVSSLVPGDTDFPGALLAGYTVVFRDAATNQVISSVDNLIGGGFRDIYADVFVPTTARGGDIANLYFRAASPTTNASDDIFDRVTVVTARGVSVKENNTGQVAPGGSVTYLHTVTNTGNITETNIALGKTGDGNGFSSVVYLDANNNGILDDNEQGAPYTSIPTLDPGQSVGIFVKVFGPAQSTQVGGINTTTLTANLDNDLTTDTFDAGGASGSAQDATTLVVGDVKLDKLQSLDGINFVRSNLNAAPGATIYYRIIVTNTGTADVTQVTVNDATPAYTTALTAPAATYTTTDPTTGAITVVTLGAASQPLNNGTGFYTFPVGTLQPGRSSTINFAVKVQGQSPE